MQRTLLVTILIIGLSLYFLSGCFVAVEAGVAMPVSGPVEKTPTTTLGFAIGWAYDVEEVLIALGGDVTVQEFTRKSGEIDSVASTGLYVRGDLPIAESYGDSHDKVLRLTSTVRFGGCRDVIAEGEEFGDRCQGEQGSSNDSVLVSLGVGVGARSPAGETLSFSLSPYYMTSSHPVQPTIRLGGVLARVTITGVPKLFEGLMVLGKHHNAAADRRKMQRAAQRNKSYRDAMSCSGTWTSDGSHNGQSYCKR